MVFLLAACLGGGALYVLYAIVDRFLTHRENLRRMDMKAAAQRIEQLREENLRLEERELDRQLEAHDASAR